MNVVKNSTPIFSFLLEISAIFILGYWGFSLQASKFIRVAVGLLAPTLMIVIWSIWCAPVSNHRLEGLWLIWTKCLLFGIVLCCLLYLEQFSAAVIWGIFVLLNLGISSYFGTL